MPATHPTTHDRDPRVGLALAAATSIAFALLFWVWERDMIWMLAVLLPPIWSPAIYGSANHDADRHPTSRRTALLATMLGVVVLLGIVTFLAVS